MKRSLSIILFGILMAVTIDGYGQEEVNSLGQEEVDSYNQEEDRKISEETTIKKYKMYEDGQLVEKSIKIYTAIRQDVKFDTLVENNIDANRIQTPKEITKRISLDNDADDDIDETIQFSYSSNDDEDFLINANDEEIFKSLENSKYLNVKDKKDMSEENLNELIIITGQDGKVIQLVLEEQEADK